MKKQLIYIIMASILMFCIQSCTVGDAKEVSTPTIQRRELRKYKITLVKTGLTEIKMLQYGFTPGDTVDAYPSVSNGAIILGAIKDTL